ncbi:hypothetical protein AB0910_28445 [Streptomyces sp. NPDC047002]|uniref:hypothetical protein n=1 Tax=Streptomyces sp. NPDC047002 TaxID=3155475 RepID=UPI003456C86C
MRGLRSHRPSLDGDGGDGDGRGRSAAVAGPAPRPGRARRRAARVLAAGGSTAAGLAGLATIGLLAGGCSSGGTGMRDEGPAVPAPVERTMPTPTETPKQRRADVDPVALLRADPQVSERVKQTLKPCGSDSYPVNTSYGNLTGGSRPDIVINVTTCADSIGIGTYVYRATDGAPASSGLAATAADGTPPAATPSAADGGFPADTPPRQAEPLPGRYENVFTAEEPSVYATIDRGELVVTQQVYAKGDSVSSPSGEDVVTYDWSKSKFAVRYRVRNTYSKSTDGDDDLSAPAPDATASASE